MGLLDSLRRALAKPTADGAMIVTPAPSAPEPKETQVPEIAATVLLAELRNSDGHSPLLLDCREPYERRQGHIAHSLHIPMNQIPYRLAELDKTADIIVYCAHGNRSYSVAAWLIEQGYSARSLKGGIVDWQARGGPTARET